MLQSHNLVSSSVVRTPSNYRVMLLRANGEVALVCLAKTRSAAVKLAEEARKKHLTRLKTHWQLINKRADRPRMLFVEEWHGTPTDGYWRLVRRDGFKFEFHDRRRGRPTESLEPTAECCKAGSHIKCVLLLEKTRKGGWRAEVVGTQHRGPVTNWQAIPTNCTAGTEVELKLCSISHQTGAAQFAWPS